MLEQTKNTLSELKMHGALKTIDLRIQEAMGQNWGHIDLISILVTDEKLYRDNHAIQRRLKAASFRIEAICLLDTGRGTVRSNHDYYR